MRAPAVMRTGREREREREREGQGELGENWKFIDAREREQWKVARIINICIARARLREI